MPTTRTLDIDWSGNWGGYMDLHVTGTLTCVLSDSAPYTLDCTLTDLVATPSYGTGGGYGFVNVGGIMWYREGLSLYQAVDTEDPETWANAYDDLAAWDANINTDAIYLFAASDEGGNPPAVTHADGPQNLTHTYTFAEYPSGSFELVSGFERYRINTSPAYSAVGYGGGFTITFDELFGWVPGAELVGGAWQTQDSATQDQDMRLVSGVWRSIVNHDDVGTSQGLVLKGAAWVPSPKAP